VEELVGLGEAEHAEAGPREASDREPVATRLAPAVGADERIEPVGVEERQPGAVEVDVTVDGFETVEQFRDGGEVQIADDPDDRRGITLGRRERQLCDRRPPGSFPCPRAASPPEPVVVSFYRAAVRPSTAFMTHSSGIFSHH
jgi:hypothetical protein